MYRNCSECQKRFLYITCSPYVLSLEFSCIELVLNSMKNLWLVDAKIRASDKDLPVHIDIIVIYKRHQKQCHQWVPWVTYNVLEFSTKLVLDYIGGCQPRCKLLAMPMSRMNSKGLWKISMFQWIFSTLFHSIKKTQDF